MFWALALLWPLYTLMPGVFALGLITAGIYFAGSICSIDNVGYRLAITPDEYQGRVNSLHRLAG